MVEAVGEGRAGASSRSFRPGARGGYGLDLQKVFPLQRIPQVQAGRHGVGTSYRSTVALKRRVKDINGV